MVAQAVRQRKAFNGLRHADPSRDMNQIAALMEEAFGKDLTRQSREALRELKIMSYLGPFLWLLDRTSPEFHETFRGLVWVKEGRIIGNVNVGRSDPYSGRWLISNVAVHPAYQGRGIARHLVQAAIDLAREQGGEVVLLQVHTDNIPACRLYQDLGFEQIAAVTELRSDMESVDRRISGAKRQGARFRPEAQPEGEQGRLDAWTLARLRAGQGFVLRGRRYSEWHKEYALALAATTEEAQWLKPVEYDHFMLGLDQRFSRWLSNLFTGRSEYRLAVEEGDRFIATLTVQASCWRGHHRLEMMVHPDYRGQLEEMLLTKALRVLEDYPERAIVVAHPAEHREAIETFRLYGFIEKRTLIQMRLAL